MNDVVSFAPLSIDQMSNKNSCGECNVKNDSHISQFTRTHTNPSRRRKIHVKRAISKFKMESALLVNLCGFAYKLKKKNTHKRICIKINNSEFRKHLQAVLLGKWIRISLANFTRIHSACKCINQFPPPPVRIEIQWIEMKIFCLRSIERYTRNVRRCSLDFRYRNNTHCAAIARIFFSHRTMLISVKFAESAFFAVQLQNTILSSSFASSHRNYPQTIIAHYIIMAPYDMRIELSAQAISNKIYIFFYCHRRY